MLLSAYIRHYTLFFHQRKGTFSHPNFFNNSTINFNILNARGKLWIQDIPHTPYLKKRFKALLQKTTVKEAAIKTKTSTGSISGWADDNKEIEPSLSSIAKIAEAFQVSPNYLLGYDKKETSQERVQKIMEYTGLNKNALKALRGYREDAIQMKIINYLLSNNILLETLSRYLMTNLYENFANDEDYKYLPKQETYKDYKLNSYDIIEKLSVLREDFTHEVQNDREFHGIVFNKFYNEAINWTLCTAYYIATDKEKKYMKNYFSTSKSLITKISKKCLMPLKEILREMIITKN